MKEKNYIMNVEEEKYYLDVKEFLNGFLFESFIGLIGLSLSFLFFFIQNDNDFLIFGFLWMGGMVFCGIIVGIMIGLKKETDYSKPINIILEKGRHTRNII